MLSLPSTFLAPSTTALVAPLRQSNPTPGFASTLKAQSPQPPPNKPSAATSSPAGSKSKSDSGSSASRANEARPADAPEAPAGERPAPHTQRPSATSPRRGEQRAAGAGPGGQPVPPDQDPTTPTLEPALLAGLQAFADAESRGVPAADASATGVPTDPGAAAIAAMLAATVRPPAADNAPAPTGGDAKTPAARADAVLSGTAALASAQRGTAQRHETPDQLGFGLAMQDATAPTTAPAGAAAAAGTAGALASTLAAWTRGQAPGQAGVGGQPDDAAAALPEGDTALAGTRRAGQPRDAGRGSAEAAATDAVGGPRRALAASVPRSDGPAAEPVAAARGPEAGGARALAPTADSAAAALQGLQGGSPVPQGTVGASAVAQARVDVPVHQPGFGSALGAQVSLLVRDGVQEAKLQLHPVEMGPITVQIALNGGAARIDFQAEVAATRSAIEASLPALAGALQDAGFTLSGGGVSQHGGQGGQPEAGDGRQRGSADPVGQRGLQAAEGGAAPVGSAPAASASRGLVDLVA